MSDGIPLKHILFCSITLKYAFNKVYSTYNRNNENIGSMQENPPNRYIFKVRFILYISRSDMSFISQYDDDTHVFYTQILGKAPINTKTLSGLSGKR